MSGNDMESEKMTSRFDKHILNNGMVILGEPMDGVESAAFDFRLPCGEALLPEGCCGAGSIITDWVFRGAGTRNSRELIDALDGLGLHRGSNVGSSRISFCSALESSSLEEALSLYADIICRPQLDAEQFELSKQLAIADIVGLDDDPRSKVMLSLYEQFYPNPLGRPSIGRLEDIKGLTAEKISGIISKGFDLSGSVLSVAGKYDFDAVCRQAEKLFDTEQKKSGWQIEPGQCGDKYQHIDHDGAQVHIGLMTKTVNISSEDYYNVMAAVSILSGGMSGRLFTEVREKRGLCYAVGARYSTLKDFAGVTCYAGTTPDKAQETLDVIKAEFARMADGITDDEIGRAKVGLKSSLIMQSESTSARASGIASDFYLLDRVRSIDEIKEKLEETSKESVERFLRNNKFEDFTVVTIGPQSIQS